MLHHAKLLYRPGWHRGFAPSHATRAVMNGTQRTCCKLQLTALITADDARATGACKKDGGRQKMFDLTILSFDDLYPKQIDLRNRMQASGSEFRGISELKMKLLQTL